MQLFFRRDQRVDPFERVSRAIRTELRENLLPVIATALAEISSSPPSKQASAASPSSILSQQEQLLKRCTETMSQLFASFTRQLAPAITEALSGTLERHLANMIIRQAEQGDAIAQMRAIMLAEQMKREQLNTTLEADMQIIKAQLQNLTAQQRSVEITKPDRHVSNGGYPPLPSSGHDVAAGNVIGTANDPVPRLSRSNPSLDRPSTPSAAYEDMFLHALSRNPDPLKDLIDDAPLTRMDRVLPYDGQPRITAPAFLALCIRLAQDFDNDLATLDAGNERVRLAWILASLRAAKWAKGDPVLAAYLPRVFTQVMHSLNRRKQKLKKPEEREELSRALQMADELSGLW